MAKIEKIGNIQIVDNKEDKFFYFPMISMACTGSVGTVEMFVTGEDRLFDVGLQLFIHVFRKKSPFHGRGKGLWL